MKTTNQSRPTTGFTNQLGIINVQEFIDPLKSRAHALLEQFAIDKSIDPRLAATGLNEMARALVTLSSQILSLTIEFSVLLNLPVIHPAVQEFIDYLKTRSAALLQQYEIRKSIDSRSAITDLNEVGKEVVIISEQIIDLSYLQLTLSADDLHSRF